MDTYDNSFLLKLNKHQTLADKEGAEGFLLKIWDTPVDRKKCKSRVEDLSFETLMEAIEKAREIFIEYSLACVEVISDDEHERSFFHLSCDSNNKGGDFVQQKIKKQKE